MDRRWRRCRGEREEEGGSSEGGRARVAARRGDMEHGAAFVPYKSTRRGNFSPRVVHASLVLARVRLRDDRHSATRR